LRFAQQFPAGRVYAFEPTDYAWQKLIRNVALNPELAKRIETFKCFVSETDSEAPQLTAYASWKVNGKETNIHPIHGGIQKPATSTPSVTLDDFCRRRNIQKVDLIKIDTDGHEMAILKGARQTLKASHPYIILEIGQYQLAEQKSTFQEFWQLLTECGYKHLVDSKKGTEITPDNYRKIIPDRTSIDVVTSP
jgi:FkbM family methyltransferase